MQDMMQGKRIMVIGAGVSGLGAIKICPGGTGTHLFEESNDIGGLWRYEVSLNMLILLYTIYF